MPLCMYQFHGEKSTAKKCLTTKFSDYQIRLFDETYKSRAQHEVVVYVYVTHESRIAIHLNEIKMKLLMPLYVL